MNGYVYKYTTRGIYEWGSGWVSREAYSKWKEFWDDFIKTGYYIKDGSRRESIHWRVLKREDESSCDTLVCLGGSMYLHPMDGEMFRREIGSTPGDGCCKELKDILFSCIKFIGVGEVDVSTVPAEIKIKKQKRKVSL